MKRTAPILLAACCALTACADMSGLDGSSKFACKAPDGVTCMSVSGIYANSKANNLPAQQAVERLGDSQSTSPSPMDAPERNATVAYDLPAPIDAAVNAPPRSPKTMNAPHSGVPLRTPERVLRIWIAPFEDQEGDLHDQQYVYLTVTPGRWTIEANRLTIRSQYQPLFLLNRNSATAPAGQQPRGDAKRQPEGPTQGPVTTTPTVTGEEPPTDEKGVQ